MVETRANVDITRVLDAVRGRLRLRILLAGGARVLRDATALALATFAVDIALEPPRPVRILLAVTCVATVLLSAWRHFAKRLATKFSDDELALLVERSHPELNDRVISALQLGRDLASGATSESPDLIRATILDAERATTSLHVGRAVPMGPIARPLFLASFAIALATTLVALRPEWAKLWVERYIFLKDTPWPRATSLRLVVTDEERYAKETVDGRVVLHVPERMPLQVQVEAIGVVPDEVELVIAPADDPSSEAPVTMGRAAGKGWFQHNFPPLDRSIMIHARGGDDRDRDPTIEIRVDRAPRVTGLATTLEFPAYTGLAPRTGDERNLTLPEGTRVAMSFKVNLDLEAFDIVSEKAGTVRLQSDTDGTYRYAFVASVSDFYTWRLRAKSGVPSADVPRYVLTVAPDTPPRVTLDSPASTSLVVTPDAVIPFRGIATDDHGISSIEIRYSRLEEGLPYALPLGAEDLVLTAPTPTTGITSTMKRVAFASDIDVSKFAPPAESQPAAKPAGGVDVNTTLATPDAPKADDRIRFRLLVSDNRVTPDHPEPHRQYGDAEYRIEIKKRDEVERDLAQKQTRLRDRVRDLLRLAEARLTEAEDLVTRSSSGSDGPVSSLAKSFQVTESGQSRVTAEVAVSARQFSRVFDGYLYNRLDPGPLTNRLLGALLRLWRERPAEDALVLYGRALEEAKNAVSDTQLLGRLVNILDLFIRSATVTSPEATRRLGQAALASTPEARLAEAKAAIAAQKSLVEDLRLLEDRLLAWEDYLDVVQGLQDLIELQKGIRSKAEKLSNK